MVTEQQACFSEFRFAPYTGLGSEWVQLQLERSFARWLWWGAHCAGSVGAWPGGCRSGAGSESGATGSRARGLTVYLGL